MQGTATCQTEIANFYRESWQLESAHVERMQAYIDELQQMLRKREADIEKLHRDLGMREAVIDAQRKALSIELEQLVASHLGGPANDD